MQNMSEHEKDAVYQLLDDYFNKAQGFDYKTSELLELPVLQHFLFFSFFFYRILPLSENAGKMFQMKHSYNVQN